MRAPIVWRRLNLAAVCAHSTWGWLLLLLPPPPTAQMLPLLPEAMGKAQPLAELSTRSPCRHSCHSTIAQAGLHRQGGAGTEPCFPLADWLCKPSDFQSPGAWIYGLRPVPSSHLGRGLGDSGAHGLTLHQGYSSCVHRGQHEPGSNPTATSAWGTETAAVLVEKH